MSEEHGDTRGVEATHVGSKVREQLCRTLLARLRPEVKEVSDEPVETGIVEDAVITSENRLEDIFEELACEGVLLVVHDKKRIVPNVPNKSLNRAATTTRPHKVLPF